MDIRFIARTADGRSGHDSLADHARRQLQNRLMHCSDRVAHVSVRIGGTGSRRDTYCVMQVQVRGAPAGTVVDIGADAWDTIDRTAARVGRLVDEQLRAADGRRLPSRAPEEIAA
jgi:hypothetical protein